MNDTKFYYKVVKYSLGILYSSWARSLTIQYEMQETSYPLCGKLFIFDTLQNAIDYCNDCVLYNIRILKCTIEGEPIYPKTVLDFTDGMSPHDNIIKKFWSEQWYNKSMSETPKKNYPYVSKAIKGTVLVDSITPIEIVI